MNFDLSEDHIAIRDEILRFASRELNDGVMERDRTQEFPRDLWLKCGEIGLQGLPVPQEYGGAGVDPLSTAIALDALGYACHDGGLAFSICAHLLACVVPVWKHGSPEQKEKYLPKLCDGTLIAVNAMSEPGSGSDAFAMKARAVPDGDGYRLTGTKTWSTNGPVADLAVVYALTDADRGYHGGVSAFLVDRDTAGYVSGQKFEKMGLRSSPIGEIVLDDLRVPKSAMLGKPGGGTVIFTQSMEWERVCIGAKHCGTMQRLMESAIAHARERSAFGKAIGKHQAVAHKIADMKIRLEACRLLAYKAASRLDKARDVAMDASMVKIFASESLVQTALETVQIFGGTGYMTETQIERTLRDSIAGKIYSGPNEVQRDILAKWLGL